MAVGGSGLRRGRRAGRGSAPAEGRAAPWTALPGRRGGPQPATESAGLRDRRGGRCPGGEGLGMDGMGMILVRRRRIAGGGVR